MEGGDDSSGKDTAILCCFWRDWLCFDDSEEQDGAKWEQDKEREADDVGEEGGEANEQIDEGNDETFSPRILEDVQDVSCSSFDFCPTLADDVTIGQITSIFLQNVQIISIRQSTNTHSSNGVFDDSHFSFQINLDGFLYSEWLVPPNCKGDRI